MKSVQETWDLLDRLCAPLQAERVALASAHGRVLREDALADADQPPFSRSAMDGYLLRTNEPESFLRLDGEIAPGVAARMPDAGCAIRVFTGSAVPEQGAAVVMQEDVQREGDFVRLLKTQGPEHIRPRGVHARRGDVLVSAGNRLTSGRIALLASAGIACPMVSPVVRVAHIATGGEIVGCDEEPNDGQIRDSNSPMIHALLCEAGAQRTFHRRLDESPASLKTAIADALEAGVHMLLVSGGASVGDHDHTRTVLLDEGFELLVESVKSRPGKPLIVARKNGVLAFGLPGNPLSHFVCFQLFVRRAIVRFAGEQPPALLRVRVADAKTIRANPRESWLPCRVAFDNAAITARTLPWRDSSDLTALAQVQGLLRVPPEGLEPAGTGELLPTGIF
jgi:molybdopterin molybdotransferase